MWSGDSSALSCAHRKVSGVCACAVVVGMCGIMKKVAFIIGCGFLRSCVCACVWTLLLGFILQMLLALQSKKAVHKLPAEARNKSFPDSFDLHAIAQDLILYML